MKKLLLSVCIALRLICFGCSAKTNEPPTNSLPATSSSPDVSQDSGGPEDYGCGVWEADLYRDHYYNLPAPYADLVDRDVFFEWYLARPSEERHSECVAVSFIKHFNIKKRDFNRANEAWRSRVTELGWTDSPSGEVYDVDLLYTFDNEKINEYFLWKNGPDYWSEEKQAAETTSTTAP